MDVTRTARWLGALQALLPPGQAISRDPAANTTQLLEAFAAMFGDTEQGFDEWFAQYDPNVATTMLADWERLLGLPDCCDDGVALDLAQRRANVLERLTVLGGQTPQWYIELMARRGVAVTIDELGNHTWRVNAPMAAETWFRAGQSRAGDSIRTWGNAPMECRINRLKPAHTVALFGYSDMVDTTAPLWSGPIAGAGIGMGSIA